MRIIRSLRLQRDWLLRRSRAETDLNDELQDYIERQMQSHLAKGLPPEEARLAALREVGGVEQLKEECRATRPVRIFEILFQDLHYGVRQLRIHPVFTVTAVLTLALGIGVNTTIFSLVSAMLLRKPPIYDPDRVVMLLTRNTGPGSSPDESSRLPVSAPDFLDWRAQATSFEAIAASSQEDFSVAGPARPQRVPGARVTSNYFQVLGLSPMLGRAFTAGEDQAGHDRVALIREDLWKGRFGGDPNVIGRAVKINGDTVTVIGIVPSTLRKMWLFPAQVWIPLVLAPRELEPHARNVGFLQVFARLRRGVTEATAKSELLAIGTRVVAAHPEAQKSRSANLMTVQAYAIEESGSKRALLFLQAAVGVVLLIACANVGNLLLARNSSRQREFAIRAALGAGRFRLVTQLLTECITIALLGAMLGLLFTIWGVALLRAGLNWDEYAVLTGEQLSIDGAVLLFAIALSLASVFIFGLAPALKMSRSSREAGLKDSSRTTTSGRERSRLQKLLVASQLALAVILLVGSSLFVADFIQEMRADAGLNPHNTLTASVQLRGATYATPAAQSRFFQNVLRQLSTLPQVESAAVTSDLPFTFPNSARFEIEGRLVVEAEKQASTGYFAVTAGYFTTAQIALYSGREFAVFDKADAPAVAIVNRAFAEKFFPKKDPLGRRIRLHRESLDAGSADARWSTIVGVVANVNEYLGELHPRPHVFVPLQQQPERAASFFVRLRTDPAAFTALLQKAVWTVDKEQPVSNIRTMNRVLRDAGQGDDLMSALMGVFAVLSLVMAAFGIYGVIAFLVRRRTREIGVRMAVGATRREVVSLVMRNSTALVLIGVGSGFLGSLALPQLIAGLFTVQAHLHSRLIVSGIPIFVIIVALASSFVPARAAAKVDPVIALRDE